ncbi:MAG: RDD family protein [Salibaculum sp.]|uniref:RDD family protein n=1 Tax=Salibaculum sp. TaxID=2855480 RepID=UPI002870636F|nr:RDD family protein [Salibaculum sp.]MDR9427569.1 RDD family protein [Salibaculum sp.]MDR9481558.1 RDD family protein [Salibaculum sp.]
MTRTLAHSPGHPDPDRLPEFYRGVPGKRVIAWLLDWVVASVISALLLPLTFFLGLFVFPVMVAVVGFFYRWSTLAGGSATWGMRLMAAELRDTEGLRLDGRTAFLHVALHYGLLIVWPGLLGSGVVTLMTPKRQGLHDLVLGTVALNRTL